MDRQARPGPSDLGNPEAGWWELKTQNSKLRTAFLLLLALDGGRAQYELAVVDVEQDPGAGCDLAGEDHGGERILDQALDRALQWPGAEVGIEALMGQQPGGRLGGLDLETLIGEQPIEVGELDVDDLFHVGFGEAVEDQDVVDTVEELRTSGLAVARTNNVKGGTS